MINTIIPSGRRLQFRDEIVAMVVEDRQGRQVWAGEFHSTYGPDGDDKVGKFFQESDVRELSWAHFLLADGSMATEWVGGRTYSGLI